VATVVDIQPNSRKKEIARFTEDFDHTFFSLWRGEVEKDGKIPGAWPSSLTGREKGERRSERTLKKRVEDQSPARFLGGRTKGGLRDKKTTGRRKERVHIIMRKTKEEGQGKNKAWIKQWFILEAPLVWSHFTRKRRECLREFHSPRDQRRGLIGGGAGLRRLRLFRRDSWRKTPKSAKSRMLERSERPHS